MDAFQLGPFVIPVQVGLPLLGLVAANLVAAWFQRRRGRDPGPILWKMTLAGFLSARLVFVLRHFDLYQAAPLSLLDIRDGGFDGTAGLVVACIVGAELTRRQAPLRRPLLAATLAGCAVWIGGTLLNQTLTPPGAPLPAVEVRRLDGTVLALDSLRGKPVLVNLWATWCPPCRREMPALKAAQQAHPEVEFVFVNQGESTATVERFLAAEGLRMQNITLDPARHVSASTGSPGYPTTLFYDASGRLRWRHVGELSQASLREKLGGER